MLNKILPDIQKTATLVQEISAASIEQNAGTEQINQGMQQLDAVVQQNSSASEEMAATAEELSAQAAEMRSTIAALIDIKGGVQVASPGTRRHRTQVAHIAKEKTQGAFLQLGSGSGGEDELDNDFERM